MATRLDDTIKSKFKIQKEYSGNRYQAYCPAHEDKNASLSILISDKKILLYCHAGCKVGDILKATGLDYSDLFLDTKPPVAIYQYRKRDGNLSHEKLKYKTPKGKRFSQRHVEGDNILDNLEGIEKIPYNYPTVIKAINMGSTIIYTEGEKDADTATLLNYAGTTMGGASDWKDEYKHYFRKASIVLIPDKDDAGLKHANKIMESLEKVCKSLKLVVLPSNKDLTEWVESGNSNISDLIANAIERVSYRGIPDPSMDILINGYYFNWNGLNLKVIINRLKNDDEGEITVLDNDIPIYISGIRLLSVSHKSALSKVLNTQRKLDWDRILNVVSTKCLEHMRQGEPIIYLDSQYGSERPEYLLSPLFVKNAANIIYADKSSAKSLFMTLIDIALSLPWHDNKLGLNITPYDRHNVLFLDWENDAHITGWQKECIVKGMELVSCDIPYLHCERPLSDMLEHIRDKIAEVKADVIIIDSLGMAVGDDLNLTKPAFLFYSSLRQLPVTPIIIAHTSKDISIRRKTVYGNAYYENEARSVWEVHKEQQPGENHLNITLFNRKSPPFASYHEPIGFLFEFNDDTIIVKKTVPSEDKSTIITSEPSENDIALEILMCSDRPLSPKEVLEQSDGRIKATNIWTVLKRLVERKKYNVLKDANGKYLYTEQT